MRMRNGDGDGWGVPSDKGEGGCLPVAIGLLMLPVAALAGLGALVLDLL